MLRPRPRVMFEIHRNSHVLHLHNLYVRFLYCGFCNAVFMSCNEAYLQMYACVFYNYIFITILPVNKYFLDFI